MCSTREARLARLRAAIDEVARAAHADPGEHADPEELAERLAGLWAMVAELDPGLAARLRGYCPDTSLRVVRDADLVPRLATRDSGAGAGGTTRHARRERRCGALLPDDLDFDRGGHLGVQPHLDLVRPDGLDRAGQLDPAPVEFGSASGAHRLRDVRGADRAEQAPGVARLDGQADVEPGEPRRGLLGVVEAVDVAGRARSLDQFDLLFRAAGPAHGQAAGDQVVAAVAPGHLHDVTGRAQPGDFLGEDQLHRCATHLSASPAGRRARGAPDS